MFKIDKIEIDWAGKKLKLETGTDDALISYASGSTTNTLSFTYPIVSPHNSDNLNYYSTDAIT